MRQFRSNDERILFLNQAAEELARRQAENLVADYDAALAEYRDKNRPFVVRFGGRNYELPRSMPFAFTMFYLRHCLQRRGGRTVFEVPDDRLGEFLTLMFGRRFARDIETSGVEVNFVMSRIVPDIMGRWGLSVTGSQSEGDPGPQTQTPAS